MHGRMESTMNKLSKYTHIYSMGEYHILYHAITTKVFLISNLQVQKLTTMGVDAAFSDYEINLLKSKKMVINLENGENEISINEIIKKNNHEKPDVFILYLLLSERCNMNCLYCSHSYRERAKQGDMNLETVLNALDKFYAVETKRKRSVVLYGGEPLMNKKGVMAAVNYIRQDKEDKETEIVIITNGTFLEEQLVKYFSSNDVKIIISVDGNKEIHDQFRKIGNKGTFDYIEQAVSILNHNGVRYGLSATIAAHNIEKLNEVVEYFYQKFNPVSVGLNPLHKKTLGDISEYEKDPFMDKYSVESEDVAQSMISAFKVARRNGLYVEQIMRRIRPFILSTPRLKDCPACGGMIRVLADGTFGPCGQITEKEKNVNLDTCYFRDCEIVKDWNNRLSCMLDNCNNCEAMALCGGGCPANSVKNGNDVFCIGIGEQVCCQAKIILKWLLNEITTYFPKDNFIEVKETDKLKLLGNIDINFQTPLCEASKYGEFKLDKMYK